MFLATCMLGGLGVTLGLLLGLAARIFAVAEENPLIREIEAAMPGTQCGQCGFPGCSAAASALADGTAAITCCPPGGKALVDKLAAILGVNPDAVGDIPAVMVASINEAECTGCTKCYRACPTDAVVGANGQIHVVLKESCTGCAKCVDACPENCVTMAREPETLESWHWAKPQAA